MFQEQLARACEFPFKGWDKSIPLNIKDGKEDPVVILEELKPHLRNVIKKELQENSNIKITTLLNLEFMKVGETKLFSEPFFRTKAITIDQSTNIDNEIDNIKVTLLMRIETYQSKGSNWIYNETKSFTIGLSKHRPLLGSSYMNIPEKIKNTKSVINIKNDDDKIMKQYSKVITFYPSSD